MKRLIVMALMGGLVAAVSLKAGGDDATQEREKGPVAPLMQRKLERSKSILEGLALEDYELVAKSARAMKVLSLESGWQVIQTEEFMKQSVEFRRACETIAQAAESKDMNRAALSYVALTVRCIECHGYMRRHSE